MLHIFLAFLATVMTAVQSLLIYTRGQALCFNNGCAIVESLTTVPPLYFNLAGFLFFFVLLCCFYLGQNGSLYWLKFARLLLLAGLVAEAVLIFFQHSIAQVFCSYCLLVLCFIVLLNLLSGARQIFRGIILFTAVMVACFSLQFGAGSGAQKPLSEGAIAVASGAEGGAELILFFSDSCPHCEKVIDSLREENSCTVAFNPVTRIEGFAFPGARITTSYDPEVSLGFMKNLSLMGIPVLVAREGEEIRVINGGAAILHYVEKNCRLQAQEGTVDYSGSSAITTQGYPGAPVFSEQADDNCRVDVDCVDQEDAPVSEEAGQ